MSRSVEEAKALDERILQMKKNSERLQRRHLEVEEDKLYAAQQNALVQVVSPPGNDWVIRNRNDQFEYVDDHIQPESPSEGFGEGRGRGRGWGRGRGRREPRRSWASEHDDRADEPLPQPAPRERRSGPGPGPGFEQRSGRERWAAKTSHNTPSNSGNMVIGNWEDPATESRRPSWRSNHNHNQNHNQNHDQSVIPSKVYSNTSLEGPPPLKAKYRLAEGDGPPPDPSYSFLGDSMRDGSRPPDRRKENNRGPDRSDRGPDRSDRGPDRSDRGPDRSDRGPDRSDRGPDRSDRGPDRSDRGPDRSDRGPDRSDRRPGSGRRVMNQGNRRPAMPQRHESYNEWRRERDAIDERRINKQKTSDGHWSREWDNDKIVQNDASPPRYSSGDTWGNGRRRYNNRFGDFLDDSFQKRPRTRSNQSQVNSSGSSGSKSPEKEGSPHDQRNFKLRRQFSNEKHLSKSSYDSTPHENRRSSAVTISKPMSPSARLEAARRATGPVLSTLRQYDTDVCTVTLPSSYEASAGSPDKNSQASPSSPSPTLKVSVRTDGTGKRTRTVEGDACPHLTTQLQIDSKKNSEIGSVHKRRQRMVKTRKKCVSQSSQSKDDDSWEDLSSEEDVSFVADLPGPSKTSLITQVCAKSQDVSSGPESLDPIPTTNKEEELLWEEFHPAGFQNNMTLAMVTETAYKALLSKEEGEESDAAEKSDEAATKLDPILVVTQIVKAEVDCMSFTSVTTDSSLPEDINIPIKSEAICAGEVDAEELSGPVSILEIPTLNGECLSAVTPISTNYDQCSVETSNVDIMKEAMISENTDTECSDDLVGKEEIQVSSERKMLSDEHRDRSVSEAKCVEVEEDKKSEILEGQVIEEDKKSEILEGQVIEEDKKSEDLEGQVVEEDKKSEDLEGQVIEEDKKSENLGQVIEEDKKSEDLGQVREEDKKSEGLERQVLEEDKKSEDLEGQVIEEDKKSMDLEGQVREEDKESADTEIQVIKKDKKSVDLEEQVIEEYKKSVDLEGQVIEEDKKSEDLEGQVIEEYKKSVDLEGQVIEEDKKSEDLEGQVIEKDKESEDLEGRVIKEDLKRQITRQDDLKAGESYSGDEKKEEKPENVNGEYLSTGSEAVSDTRGRESESMPSSVSASDSGRIDGKDSLTLTNSASNSDDKTTDNREDTSENTASEADSPSSGVSR